MVHELIDLGGVWIMQIEVQLRHKIYPELPIVLSQITQWTNYHTLWLNTGNYSTINNTFQQKYLEAL